MATYLGDINDRGTVEPPTVDVVNGVHEDVIPYLESASRVSVSRTFGNGMGAMFRGMEINEVPGKLMYGIRVGVEMNKVNLKKAREQGLATLNTPGESTEAVARRAHTFALTWASDVMHQTAHLRGDRFEKKGGQPLDRMTIVVVGFGRIGRAFAERMHRDAHSVLVFDPHVNATATGVSDALHRKLEVIESFTTVQRNS